MLDTITEFFLTLSPGWLYCALFASAYIENVVPPIPGDTVVVFAAYLVGRTQQPFLGVFIATTLGSIAGFMTTYAVGRLINQEYLIRRDFRLLPAASIRKAGGWLERYGYWLVLANRFCSGIRCVISVVAGFYRLPWPRVLAATALSCAVWNGLLIWLGYVLGANWRAIESILQRYTFVLATLFVLVLVAWMLRKRARRNSDRNPLI